MPHLGNIQEDIIDRILARRGKVHVFDSWVPQETALLVIDMQRTFLEEGAPAEVPQARSIVPAINQLSAFMRSHQAAIFWITHANSYQNGQSDWPLFYDHFVSDDVRERTLAYMKPDAIGPQLWPELNTKAEDHFITKNRYSALIPGSCDLLQTLKMQGITTLFVSGTKTNVCCESTARDAMMLGFKVFMISDCLAALSDEEHWSSLANILQQFGDVYNSHEVMPMLQSRTA